MTYKELKLKIKEEQKALAKQIKECKPLRKPRNRVDASEELLRSCWSDHSWEYRHKHIVYCYMFNGTPYEKIEQPREDNTPSSGYLEKIKNEWEALLDEAIHNCA
jgi:hypothetical protein